MAYVDSLDAGKELPSGFLNLKDPVVIKVYVANMNVLDNYLIKPYDDTWMDTMKELGKFILEGYKGSLAYVYLNEIDVVVPHCDLDSELSIIRKIIYITIRHWFENYSYYFKNKIYTKKGDIVEPYFKVDVFNLGRMGIDAFFWYRLNCFSRNSIHRFARIYYDNKKLKRIKPNHIKNRLKSDYNIDWDKYVPFQYRYGVVYDGYMWHYCFPVVKPVQYPYTKEEIMKVFNEFVQFRKDEKLRYEKFMNTYSVAKWDMLANEEKDNSIKRDTDLPLYSKIVVKQFLDEDSKITKQSLNETSKNIHNKDRHHSKSKKKFVNK